MKKVALITGGSSGIGFAVASELRKQYALILLARNKEGLQKAKDKLEQDGACVEIITQDISEWSSTLEQRVRLASLSLGGDGSIQVLTHSAGVTIEEHATSEEEEYCHRTNVAGTMNILSSCEGILSPGANVLVLSSLSAFTELPGISKVYGGSKRAVWKIAEEWRPRLKKACVSVSVVFPPVVNTPMVQALKCDAPIYRAFPWLTATEVARVSVRGMFKRKNSIHFALNYRALAFLAEVAPRTVAMVLRAYIPFIVYIKEVFKKN